MKQYLLRLDDASDHMDAVKWKRMEELLDKHGIKPIFGIIPENRDPSMTSYPCSPAFWTLVHSWIDKGWEAALHGCYHTYVTKEGGINPMHDRSEFAGLPLSEQKEKIAHAYHVLKGHDIDARIFFAPSHTFDLNTLKALEAETPIRVISDTIANDVYFKHGFYFVPQQSRRVRALPFKVCTFCYHPNMMTDAEFEELDSFLSSYKSLFCSFSDLKLKKRAFSLYDRLLRFLYMKKNALKGTD
ncbi:MAG: DUF2334 domain-containing protein [Sphaerochaetaceae bacterium]|nr:DUF2334 domain-containing protein [Sphaerochaetaceae bacterium]